MDLSDDHIRRRACQAEELCVEPDGPTATDGASRQDGLQESLWQVHVLTWTGGLIGALNVPVSRTVLSMLSWTSVVPCDQDGGPRSRRERTLRQPCCDTTWCAPCCSWVWQPSGSPVRDQCPAGTLGDQVSVPSVTRGCLLLVLPRPAMLVM